MPVLPPVNQVMKFRISGHDGGALFNNLFYFSYAGGTTPTNTQMDILCGNLLSGYAAMIGTSRYATTTQSEACEGEDLTTTSSAVGSNANVTPGTNPSEPTPAQTCLLVSHTIARRYRGGHPRTYLPGMCTATIQDSQHWTSSTIASQQTLYNSMISNFLTDISTALGGTPAYVNVSYFSGHALRVTPVVDTISGSTLQGELATQRRRVGR